MENKKIKWLIYTVLIGLIPIITRLFVWGVTKSGATNLLAASDIIAFGLVLHVSIINEIEHLSAEDKSWKTIQNGMSIIFIAIYCVLSTLVMLNEKFSSFIDDSALRICTIALAIVSMILSYTIFDRISKSFKKEIK
ncbi:hypothetical protein ACO0LM_24390 [Undibacterium sp. Di26W]|uniref:hypothetical protein n=1 Tax=Undibacterium sp. Di26W TaxID=3413035 RepID=UPI003BF3C8FF